MLETIYLTRHGFRSNWTTNPSTGTITSPIPTPTGIPSDPALAQHGVSQSHQLTSHLLTLHPAPTRIYTSPFYRCVQTISPLASALSLPIHPEPGIGEWYGRARFTHPVPATPAVLKTHFAGVDPEYVGMVVPREGGETIHELHERVAEAMARIVEVCDREGVTAVVLCTHAATNIAAGRVLTGEEGKGVRTGTCSLGVYKRKGGEAQGGEWRGRGVAGGWEQTVDGDCSFLEGGEERNWWFDGEEAWDYPVADAEVKVEEAKKEEAKI